MSTVEPAAPIPKDHMHCRACGSAERASEGYPCRGCGTFICVKCNMRGTTLCSSCQARRGAAPPGPPA